MAPSDEWYNNIRFRWIVLPVLAYVLSWSAGIAGPALFPILVPVAQYLIFKVHPAVARPGFWFFTLPITYFAWVKWGPVMTYSQPNGIYYGVAAYYASQLINTLFIPLIIKKGRPEFILNWMIGTAVNGVVWLALYWLFKTNWSEDESRTAGSIALYFIYPAIALVANGVSSFFFTKEYVQD